MSFMYDRIESVRDDSDPKKPYHKRGTCPTQGRRHVFDKTESYNLSFRDGYGSFVRVICKQCHQDLEMHVSTPAQVATFGTDAEILTEANNDQRLSMFGTFTHSWGGGMYYHPIKD